MANILGQVFQDYVHKQVNIRQQKLGGINKSIDTLQAYNSKAPFIRLISSVDLLSPPERVEINEVDPTEAANIELPNSPTSSAEESEESTNLDDLSSDEPLDLRQVLFPNSVDPNLNPGDFPIPRPDASIIVGSQYEKLFQIASRTNLYDPSVASAYTPEELEEANVIFEDFRLRFGPEGQRIVEDAIRNFQDPTRIDFGPVVDFTDVPGYGYSDESSAAGSVRVINEAFVEEEEKAAEANRNTRLKREALERAEAKARAAYLDQENLNALITSNNLEKLVNSGIPRELVAGDKLAKNFILQGGAVKYTEKIEGEKKLDIFTPNSGLNNGTVFDGAYGWGGVDERGYVPMPGITSVQTKYYNNGALSQATVNIKCYSKKQFALVDLLYLRPGYTVLLEFGHTIYLDNSGNRQLFENFLTLPALATLRGDTTQFELSALIEAERTRRAGNYEAVYGKISKFNWTFNKDGSYDCTLSIIGLGSVIESLRINTGPSKAVIGQYFKNVNEDRKVSIGKSFLHMYLNYVLVKGKFQQEDTTQAAESRRTEDALEKAYGTAFQSFTFEDIFRPIGGVVLQGVDAIGGGNTFEDVFADGTGNRNAAVEFLGLFFNSPSQEGVGVGTLEEYIVNENSFQVTDAEIKDVDVNEDGKRGTLIIPKCIVSIIGVVTDAEEGVDVLPQVYIKFGAIIALIQHKLLVYSKDKNTPICKFDMNVGNDAQPLQKDENYIFTFPGHFSSNPLVCLIPYTNLPQVPFYPDIPNFNINSKFGTCEALIGFNVEEDEYAGRLANILVNAQHALNLLDQFTSDEDGGIAILDFLQSLLSDISTSLGGINNIEVTIDNNSLVRFIDKTPQTYKFDINNSGSADDFTTFNAFGVQRDVRGSFVRDLSLNSELSPDFASMIAIGAQANGNQISSNSTSFSLYNSGLQDRIIKEKFNAVNGINTNTTDTLESVYRDILFPLQAVYEHKKFTSENISALQSAAPRFFNYVIGDLTYKESITPAFFLPFNFSVTVDGISGIKLYQKFKLTNNILPPSYTDDNVDLIVKEVNHDVSPSGWTTQIGTLSSPSPVNITGELYKPPRKPFPFKVDIDGEIITGNAGAAQPIDIEPLTASGIPTPKGKLIWSDSIESDKVSIFNALNRVMYNDYGITNPYARGAILAGFYKESKLRFPETELDYSNTRDNAYIKGKFGNLGGYTLEQIEVLKKDPEKFFNVIYASTGKFPAEPGQTENGPPESGDGYRYRGRGFVQTTKRRQYLRTSEFLGVDLIANPDLILTDLDIAIKAGLYHILSSSYISGFDINDVTSAREACNLVGITIAGYINSSRADSGVTSTFNAFLKLFKVEVTDPIWTDPLVDISKLGFIGESPRNKIQSNDAWGLVGFSPDL